MRTLIAAALALCATPVSGQATAGRAPMAAPFVVESAPTPTNGPVADDARLAEAARAVDALFPQGSYERMMRGTMDQMMDQILATTLSLTPDDLGVDAQDGEEADRPFGELLRDVDPDFEERMRWTNRALMDGLVTLMSEVEPEVRAALTQSFARRYTVQQLREMNAFFATPTGAVFARDYLLTFTDPEMLAAMQAFVPRVIERMPALMKDMEAATAHLPPSPLDTDPDETTETPTT